MIFVNNKEVIIKKFPNGECLINNEDIEIKEENIIKVRFENNEDITNLIFIKSYLDELNLISSLVIPYMPYSRMDRTEGLTLFTLKYVCNIINSLNFKTVTIYEPHSDVCVALLNRVKVVNMSANITESLIKELQSENLYLVFPDAGAEKRYCKQVSYNKILTCSKKRDFKTGRILSLDINGEIPKEEFNAIIVDDLCSKGGTFMLTAQKLKEIGAKDIYLVVTHCENSIFEGEILKTDVIKRVYTTNSILTKDNEKIIINKVI